MCIHFFQTAYRYLYFVAGWRHQMETYSALLAICSGNSPVPGEFPAQRQVTRSIGVFFDLRLITRLSKQSRGWWYETPLQPLWRQCSELNMRVGIHFGLFCITTSLYIEAKVNTKYPSICIWCRLFTTVHSDINHGGSNQSNKNRFPMIHNGMITYIN